MLNFGINIQLKISDFSYPAERLFEIFLHTSQKSSNFAAEMKINVL